MSSDPEAKPGDPTRAHKWLSVFSAVSGVAVAAFGGVAPTFIQAAHNYPGVAWLQMVALAAGAALSAGATASLGKVAQVVGSEVALFGPALNSFLTRRYGPPVSVDPAQLRQPTPSSEAPTPAGGIPKVTP